MATAITATAILGSSATPPGFALSITGAPVKPTSAYASNFTSGVDGFTVTASGTVSNDTTREPDALKVVGNTPTTATASRTVTGLVVGVAYELSAYVYTAAGQVRLSMGGSVTSYFYASKRARLSTTFTATATSHSLAIDIKPTFVGTPPAPQVYVDTVRVDPVSTWLGTTITRTDANGTDVPVRNPNHLDTVTSSLALNDYEAAMVGAVTYKVTDGSGGTATVTVSNGLNRTNLAVNPSNEAATGWFSNNGAVYPVSDDATVSHSGGKSKKSSPTGAGIGVANGAVMSMYETGGVPRPAVSAGQTVTATVWARANVPVNGYMGLAFLDSGGGVLGTATNGTQVAVATDGTWTLLRSATLTAPANTATVRVLSYMVRFGGALTTGTDVAWVDDVLVEVSASPGGYFDGNTPAAGGRVYWWTGAANASPSVESDTTVKSNVAPSLTLPGTALETGPTDPPDFATLTMATEYEETTESPATVHVVLGRSDKLSNPAPMLARNGAFTLWCTDYAQAVAVRELLKSPKTAMLRQPSFPGMDLYFVARSVQIAPTELTPTQHWLVGVSYDEVPRPV